MGFAMGYFDETDARPERLGKIVGDAFAALVYLSIGVLMFTVFLR
jgi:hypothetical protein